MKSNVLKPFLKIVPLLLILLWACSKDRSIFLTPEQLKPVEPVVTLKDENFVRADASLLVNLQTKPTKMTITTTAQLPLIGPKGTKIWIYPNDLEKADGTRAGYPIDVELVELYTPKDMILNRMPTVSDERLLTTGGELYIKASYKGEELKVSYFSNFKIEIPAKNPDPKMSLFVGEQSFTGQTETPFVNWRASKDSIRVLGKVDSLQQRPRETPVLIAGKEVYQLFPTTLGWINCDKFSNFTGPKTRMKFTSSVPNIEKIYTYLYFDRIRSIMRVYGDTSGEVPVTEHVKVVCFAVTTEKEVFLFTKELNVEPDQKIEILLNKVSEAELLTYLSGL